MVENFYLVLKYPQDLLQAPIFSYNGIDSILNQVRQYKPDMGQIEPLQRDSDSRAVTTFWLPVRFILPE